MQSSQSGGYLMEINEHVLEQARATARHADEGSLTLPAVIPGFPKLCLAAKDDSSVSAIAGVVSEKGTSYKIGPCPEK